MTRINYNKTALQEKRSTAGSGEKLGTTGNMKLGIKRLVRGSRQKHNTLAVRIPGEQVDTLRESDTGHGRKGKLSETRGEVNISK